MKSLVVLLFSCLLSISVAQAQLLIPGTNLTVTTVNGGTGSLVSIPIPGDSGLSITVGQGSAALPLQNINNLTDSTLIQMGDDGWKNIPLPFQFSYWGQSFNESTMYSNGVVQFGRPVPTNGWPTWNNAFCCHGSDLTTNTNTGHNYSIMPLWTDLVDFDGNTTYYRGTADSMTYGWYNQSQYGQRDNRNTFELKINNSGAFDVRYGGTFISSTHGVTIGMTGDLSQGQHVQLYNGMGLTGPTTGFSWGALSGTNVVDQCIINPLSLPSCPGYQAAYTTQQCAISALFDLSCPGYAAAFLTQQCSINSLYNTQCPGYAAAYLTYQCSINPLYSTTCTGYAEAYKAQQCTLDGLYDRTCPNYADAYARRYVLGIPSSGTISYGPADSRCTVGCDTSTTQNSNAGPATSGYSGPGATNVSTTQPVTSISNSGQVSTGVALTNDSNVNAAITTPRMDGPAASTGNSPVASSMNSPGPAASGSSTQTANAEPAARQEQKSEDKKDDAPKGSGGSSPSQNTGTAQASSDKPAAPTARQALQERREAAAKAEAVEKGKDLANQMGKASDLEAQKAVQNVVIQAMGFTPGFDAYGKQLIVQQQFYKPYQVYGNQKTIDNRANLRMFGGTDRLHNEMVEKQYEGR